ncbi:hypothetical protein FNV43_RR12380 [Rhamnella rubrinervis]|uniref:Uncharacterized protein n=1 Tax=Rhamnella rubrinervis TaxID=2594499 RepID=A0A8K0MIT9_9ROSA|nr:hypothetical protein FNV43_RR12380 [Rhamnella rubrinervis]
MPMLFVTLYGKYRPMQVVIQMGPPGVWAGGRTAVWAGPSPVVWTGAPPEALKSSGPLECSGLLESSEPLDSSGPSSTVGSDWICQIFPSDD